MVSEKEEDRKNRRPRGWGNPYHLPPFETYTCNPDMLAYNIYEAGANAMYQACRKKLGKMAFLLDEED